MTDSPIPLPDVKFDDLTAPLKKAAANAGWTELMPVQARAIPYLRANRNMMIQARTGSGKTGAFLLPLLEKLDPKLNECQVLILTPTRELARQVWQDSQVLFKDSGLRTVPVYGGVGYRDQLDALKQGAHVVVGTPGRVLDHLLRKVMTLNYLKMLIFDEADRMLSMGFYPDMKKVKKYMPKNPIHTCMFSATFPSHVMSTANEFMREPEFISLSQDHTHVTETEHEFCIVPGMDKDRALVRYIEIENPASAIVFCNTKSEVHYLAVVLQRFGYDADELSSDISQSQREKVLDRVRKGKLRFLVATDVAARGLDIPELSHVIQYEPPEDFEAYIHRAGRTGRAGASGVAMSLVTTVERTMLSRIAKRYGIDMQEKPMPLDEDVQAVVEDRIIALLEARLRDRDKLAAERSRRFIRLGRSLAENEEESAIIAMLLDDYYQQSLHAPFEKPSDKPVEKHVEKPRENQGDEKPKKRRRWRPNKRRD